MSPLKSTRTWRRAERLLAAYSTVMYSGYLCEVVSRDTYRAHEIGDMWGPDGRVVNGFYDPDHQKYILVYVKRAPQ